MKADEIAQNAREQLMEVLETVELRFGKEGRAIVASHTMLLNIGLYGYSIGLNAAQAESKEEVERLGQKILGAACFMTDNLLGHSSFTEEQRMELARFCGSAGTNLGREIAKVMGAKE